MKTFLIDLENVKNQGFVGVDKLSAGDRVFVFYSDGANSLNIPTIQMINRSEAAIEYVPLQRSGHNAMDFQIVGLLGFLIGSEKKGFYGIISQDQGYLAPVEFFMDHSNDILDINVLVTPNILTAIRKWDQQETAAQKKSITDRMPASRKKIAAEKAVPQIEAPKNDIAEAPMTDPAPEAAENSAETAVQAAPAKKAPAKKAPAKTAEKLEKTEKPEKAEKQEKTANASRRGRKKKEPKEVKPAQNETQEVKPVQEEPAAAAAVPETVDTQAPADNTEKSDFETMKADILEYLKLEDEMETEAKQEESAVLTETAAEMTDNAEQSAAAEANETSEQPAVIEAAETAEQPAAIEAAETAEQPTAAEAAETVEQPAAEDSAERAETSEIEKTEEVTAAEETVPAEIPEADVQKEEKASDKKEPKKKTNNKSSRKKAAEVKATAEQIEKVHALVGEKLTEEQIKMEDVIVKALLSTQAKNDFYQFFRHTLGRAAGGDLYHAIRNDYEKLTEAVHKE